MAEPLFPGERKEQDPPPEVSGRRRSGRRRRGEAGNIEVRTGQSDPSNTYQDVHGEDVGKALD